MLHHLMREHAAPYTFYNKTVRSTRFYFKIPIPSWFYETSIGLSQASSIMLVPIIMMIFKTVVAYTVR